MDALVASTCESATRRLAHRRTIRSFSALTSSASAVTASLEGVSLDTVPPRLARDGGAATTVERRATGSHLRQTEEYAERPHQHRRARGAPAFGPAAGAALPRRAVALRPLADAPGHHQQLGAHH